MTLRFTFVFAVGAVLMVPIGAQAQANLLTNGGLELIPPDGGGSHDSPPGWVTDEGPSVPEVAGPYLGDYNNGGVTDPTCPHAPGCGAVDAADWVVYRKFNNTNFPMLNQGNDDTVVNIGDRTFWRRHFNEPWTMSLAEPSNFTHILETYSPNPPAPDPDGTWQYWFQPYKGSEVEQEDNFAHLYQDVPATAGLLYTMKGWAMGEEVFPGGVNNLNAEGTGAPFNDGPPSPTNIYFALEFLNNTGAVLPGSLEKELKDDLGFVNSGDPDLVGYLWQQFTLAAIAPPGTVSVRVRASMTDGVFNPVPSPQLYRMSFIVDAFSLTAASPSPVAAPEPGTWLMVVIVVSVWSAARRDCRRRRQLC